jgi:hypothetical protein
MKKRMGEFAKLNTRSGSGKTPCIYKLKSHPQVIVSYEFV